MKIVYIIFFLISLSSTSQIKIDTIYYEFDKDKVKEIYSLNEHNQKHGGDTLFYINGSIKEISIWNNGGLNDSIIKYSQSGEIYSIGKINNDSLNFFRSDGSKEYSVGLADGLREGTAIYYSNNGFVKGFARFENNLMDGLRLSINENNLLKNIFEFSKGEIGAYYFDFYKNGRIKKISIKNNSEKGQSIEFYEDGSLKSFVETVYGQSNGLKLIFDKNGIIESSILYSRGEIIDR